MFSIYGEYTIFKYPAYTIPSTFDTPTCNATAVDIATNRQMIATVLILSIIIGGACGAATHAVTTEQQRKVCDCGFALL